MRTSVSWVGRRPGTRPSASCERWCRSRSSGFQEFVSYCRLVKCSRQSAGKLRGTGGAKIGNAHLKWAFSEAAALFLRANPKGQKYLDRLTRRYGKGKALSILAKKIGRTVYYMLMREKTFDEKRFLAA